MAELQGEADFEEFIVTFKPNTALGLRLAPRAGGFGAVFDGWKEDKESVGENHERLEVGDRLIGVGASNNVGPLTKFDTVSQMIHNAGLKCFEDIALAEEKAREAEQEAGRGLVALQVKTKYDTSSKKFSTSAAQARIVLRFLKPLRSDLVLIDESICNLDVWFRPTNSAMYGCRFAGCSSRTSREVETVFRSVEKGMALVAVNNRSIEGLPFNLALDCIKETKPPMVLRFAHIDEDDEDDQADSLYDKNEDDGTKESKTGKEGGQDIRENVLAKTDTYFKVMGEPFTNRMKRNFFESILEGDENYFLDRLKGGIDLSIRDNNGQTPLIVAASLGDRGLVFIRHLLEEGVPVDDVESSNGKTALHIAAGLDSERVMHQLIYAKCDINMKDNKNHTPLMDAVIKNRLNAVSILLRSGGNVRVREKLTGWTCLHYAALNDRADIAEELINAGNADLHAETASAPLRARRTALQIARESGSTQVAVLLHELCCSEPLQRIWPKPSYWVVDDCTSGAVDLPWREAMYNFRDAQLAEAHVRRCAVDSLHKVRAWKPLGKHDDSVRNSWEDALRPAIPEPDTVGQLWVGSMESLTYSWIQKKQIDAVVIFSHEHKTSDSFEQANPWIRHMCRLIVPRPHSFKDFLRGSFSLVTKYAFGRLEKLENVLIASDMVSRDEPLGLPLAAAIAVLNVKYQQNLKDLLRMTSQRCYFYTREEAKEKHEWIRKSKRGQFSDDELVRYRLDNEVRRTNKRAEFSPEWKEGLERIDDMQQSRKIAQTRRDQVYFRAHFQM